VGATPARASRPSGHHHAHHDDEPDAHGDAQPALRPGEEQARCDQRGRARVADADHDRRRSHARDRLALLNEREREVAVAVGQGRSNAEIGAVLYLSVPTVKTHVSAILTKLDLNNRVQVALLVHDAGLLDDRR
jgi:DNA-binding NarL/FixJ family response regulator